MSGCAAELKLKTQALSLKWVTYKEAPNFELFVEFAVLLSSFSAFLQGKGFSGLQQMSHGLEQQVLALFTHADRPPIAPAVLDDLSRQLERLTERTRLFVNSHTRPMARRRTPQEAPVPSDLTPNHCVWFVGSVASQWQALMTQLAYFNIQGEVYPWQAIQDQAEEPTVVVLETQGMSCQEVCEHLTVMRTRFSASQLMTHHFQTDFNHLKAALRAGCDFCFAPETPQATILAKLIECCSNEQETPLRVLVVEDSITASQSIEHTLNQSGVETLAVINPEEILVSLRRFQPDLILMDMYMPDCTGVEATRVIRQHAEFLSTPVVYLSGDGDMALQVDALRLGGDHFLTKPFNPVLLNAVVKSKIDRYRALRRSMLCDGLTGLLNHRAVKEKLVAALHEAKAGSTTLAVAMIDIDHFKTVNDNYGHPLGDQVIKSLAWLLKQRLRKTDLVGRYGGEEFLVVLPDTPADQAFAVLDRIRHDFSLIKYAFEDTWFEVTFSAGIAQFPATSHAEALIKKADEALYEAKDAGRNCVITHR